MGVRTGSQYLEGLRDGRDLRMDGERIRDVTQDWRLAGAARTVANLLDMQHEPALRDVMTYRSPTTGDAVGLSYIEPKSTADLMARRGCIKQWMDRTQGMFGRSPDFMNCYIAAFATAEAEFAKGGEQFGKNVRDFYEDCRENDKVMTHVLVNPQVDRSTAVEKQSKDLAAKIIGETDAGIYITGARMVATLAAFSDEIVVMPSSYLENNKEAEEYAFGFAIPTATPGMSFISRPSVVPRAASFFDNPLSLRLDENDAVVVFKNVFVPWERVFIHRNIDMCNGLYPRTHASAHTGQQAAIKALAKSEFMLGLALKLAKSTRIDVYPHVQGMLAEIMLSVETVKACLYAAENNPVKTWGDSVAPDMTPLWVVRLGFPRMFQRMQEIIQQLGASGLVGAPSLSEFENEETREMVSEYLQSVNSSARDRARLCRLAYDASMSSFAGRQQLYERFYTGDPVRLAGMLCNTYRHKQEAEIKVDELMEKVPELLAWSNG